MKTEAEIRFKQWQDALRQIKKMRAALVSLGVTDPDILGGEVMTYTGVFKLVSGVKLSPDWLHREPIHTSSAELALREPDEPFVVHSGGSS